MEYPTLNVKQKYRQMTDEFRGYNHNLRIGDGEFYDMKNMTSDHYPVLATREARGTYRTSNDFIRGIIAKGQLCYVDGEDFVIGNTRVAMGLSSSGTGPTLIPGLNRGVLKQLVSMGSYVIIMPDKKWINTTEKDGVYEFGNIDNEFETDEEVTLQLCTVTGDAYENTTVSADAPAEPQNNQLWIDTSATPHVLKKYSSSSAMWVSIATTYIKISATGIGIGFQKDDGVEIYMPNDPGGIGGNHVLWGCGDDYIIITGILDQVTVLPEYDNYPKRHKIYVRRKMPNVDFLIESGNRLWGCRYGREAQSYAELFGDKPEVTVNEIYSCKLGDFKNWNCFMGLSTDSYVASVGSDGIFTGAATHLGHPLFFKRNCLHKVYGDFPSNYQIQHTICRGVATGCEHSLATVNETLFYVSDGCVCAYDGSLPVKISEELGNERYMMAAAGAHGDKYYVSLRKPNLERALFVYDTSKGMWHKEDDCNVLQFCSYNGILFGLDYSDAIITMAGHLEADEGVVPWMVETGLIGMNMPDMKYISRLLLRMSLDIGGKVDVSIQYDSIGDWELVCSMTATSLRSFSVPVRLRRCDHFQIRIAGAGKARIYSITKTIEQGSDVS